MTTTMTTPLARYDALVADGTLTPDPVQRAAAERLNALSTALIRGKDSAPTGLARYLPFLGRALRTAPKGLYLWGGVGRGKTLLMDLFFNNTPIPSKQRVHFHEFMQGVHSDIAAWRQLTPAARVREPAYQKSDGDDPIAPVARMVAARGKLICFDEFHVNDITDAMILGRLFDDLFAEGVIVVTTSNRHPTDLYKDGLNRGLFLPFIDRLITTLDIFHLDAHKDYRLDRLPGQKVYFHPLGAQTRAAMDDAWQRLIAGATEQHETIAVTGRTLTVERAARGCARFSFEALCARALGAGDYLAIAQRYGTLLLDDIPVMTANDRNEAKRFVILIDTLYERGVKLIASADGPPEALYRTGSEAFEFDRTVSRLLEMQSKDYLSRERQ